MSNWGVIGIEVEHQWELFIFSKKKELKRFFNTSSEVQEVNEMKVYDLKECQ